VELFKELLLVYLCSSSREEVYPKFENLRKLFHLPLLERVSEAGKDLEEEGQLLIVVHLLADRENHGTEVLEIQRFVLGHHLQEVLLQPIISDWSEELFEGVED